MIKDSSTRWIVAGKALAFDPVAQIPCPECGTANLSVSDSDSIGGMMERAIFCPTCGARQFIRMKIEVKG